MREISGGDDLGVGTNNKIWDTLKSKYKYYSEPSGEEEAENNNNNNRTRRNQYLTSLKVFGSREVEEKEGDEPQSQSLPSTSFCSQSIKNRITNALMIMSFREPHVLVQFWSPIAVGKRCLLTTFDQPFGLGGVDEGLYLYRLKSEQRVLVVDEEHIDELNPPGRVYCQKLPEWSLDVHSLSNRQCVQDYAACSDIHGYINLPVFEPASGSCVGVLELITLSNYVDYAFEVREISRALKEENLRSPDVFEDTRLSTQVAYERSKYELDEIFLALKMVCEVQKLPLAQTWALAGYSSVVATSENLEKSCSSFNKRCMGKACMSTSDLPFYVRDLSTWGFHEACRQRHLDKLQGVVGWSMSSHGSCFCGDVTNLREDEYPLASYARVNGITSSLAVYLKSLETNIEYVIEFFLPAHSENEVDLQSVMKRLLKTVRQQIENSSRVQLGIMSSPQVIGGIPLHWNPGSPSSTEKVESPPESEDEQLLVENGHSDVPFSKNQSGVAYVEHVEGDNIQFEPSHSAAAVTSGSVVPCLEVGTESLDINACQTSKKFDDISDKPRKKRKRTNKTISREEISKHYGKTMEDAAVSLSVSRSTLKRICRSLGIPRWPYKNGPDKNDILLKHDQTLVAIHEFEEAHTPVFGDSGEPLVTTDTNLDRATLIEHGKHSSTLVPHQQERTDPLDHSAQPDSTIREKYIENIAANTVENLMIKATYRENTLKFAFNLSDGLVKLEELVAARFRLKLGSFSLKYVDEEGDLIMIACDNDLMASLSASKQPNIQTMIRLLVWPVINQSPDA